MKLLSIFPLRLPNSLKTAGARLAKEESTSINQCVVTAAAEKIAALEIISFFAERRERVGFAAFRKVMRRKGREPPRRGDEIPATVQKTRKKG